MMVILTNVATDNTALINALRADYVTTSNLVDTILADYTATSNSVGILRVDYTGYVKPCGYASF